MMMPNSEALKWQRISRMWEAKVNFVALHEANQLSLRDDTANRNCGTEIRNVFAWRGRRPNGYWIGRYNRRQSYF